MQVRNRLFTYPVLNHNQAVSSYNGLDFLLKFDEEENDSAFILKNIYFSTDSELINKLFSEGKVKIYCVVESSHSVYRKAFELSNKIKKNIILYKNDFTNKVVISCFAVAADNFVLNSKEFNEDYLNIDFEIEKYNILAANDGFSYTFNHQSDEANLASSIFSIIIDHDIDDGTYNVDYSMKKIVISLSDEEFDNYKGIYAVSTYKEVFFNMLLIPVLTEALTRCQLDVKDGKDIEDLAYNYMWFNSVINGYKKLTNEDLTKEVFKDLSPVLLAQQLLGKPMGKSLKSLYYEITKVSGGENDDE